MTVKELLELLENVNPGAEVRLAYDSGTCYGDAQGVEAEGGVVYISTELIDLEAHPLGCLCDDCVCGRCGEKKHEGKCDPFVVVVKTGGI